MKIAVILAGCGRFDGSEVHEATLALLAIEQAGAEWHCFAPDAEATTYNHMTGEPEGGPRNMLVEAARIARGRVTPLHELNPSNWDALVVPGGTGVARNLSKWAQEGPETVIVPDARKAIVGMHNAGKPIGFICIAPHLAALLLPGVHITAGGVGPTSKQYETAGAVHEECEATGYVVDSRRKVVSTPAYMVDATIAQVHMGISGLVGHLVELTAQ